MRIANSIFLLILVLNIASCNEEGGLKGNLTLSITDSPIDADQIKGVNLIFKRIDLKKGGDWKTVKSFDQPVGVNLLAYSGGNSSLLVTQSLDPGKYSTVRFTMNLADPNSSFIVSPQCNINFQDGSTKPLYYFEIGVTEFEVTQEINIDMRGQNDFTFDFDVRKSMTLDTEGNYIFKPVVRAIETMKAGHIKATVSDYNATDRLIVFAYGAGQFSATETAAPGTGGIRFPNAISSGKISEGEFGIGFLPAGNYDLIIAKHSASGEFISLSGRVNGVTVMAAETVELDISLTQLGGS